MKEGLEQVAQAVQHQKVAVTVTGATMGGGLSSFFSWFPENMGWIALLVGAIASLVVIYTSIRRDIREQAKFDRSEESRTTTSVDQK